ncbi:anti-sigma regulatory factor (Ser/Thr protein kinase) [Nocardiopsis mwathae]|uniref:Anti-sigma regulatory factor (Ser/Thr protein kinase) n=1 Tax=Nocardiopsis mwathae TaxID=1472723 RepID=A0A7X0D548_9ACTN|nr:ATP-binding protein [Nocardiopsis mwathae]MBB6170764.1 anti-sigma regulatory factor (Ser/Thr protein kinase) [Nocardiopsis mwathae]
MSSSPTPVPVLPEVTVPLNRFIPSGYRHYFNGSREMPYNRRRFDFWGMPELMPMVRAFLDTCAASRDADYRYLFTLLGSELATNAVRHSESGAREGSYTLLAERSLDGIKLTCRDGGALGREPGRWAGREYLAVDPAASDPDAESGRGLALVDALATDWGDSGWISHRHVWFYLAYDLRGSAWAAG